MFSLFGQLSASDQTDSELHYHVDAVLSYTSSWLNPVGRFLLRFNSWQRLETLDNVNYFAILSSLQTLTDLVGLVVLNGLWMLFIVGSYQPRCVRGLS